MPTATITDLQPYVEAARARKRGIYVWQADGQQVSSIHFSMVPWDVPYILVKPDGSIFRFAVGEVRK